MIKNKVCAIPSVTIKMTKPTSLSSPSSSWVCALLCQTLVSTTYGLCFSDRKDGRKVWKLIGRWSENERENRKKMKSREREKGEGVITWKETVQETKKEVSTLSVGTPKTEGS